MRTLDTDCLLSDPAGLWLDLPSAAEAAADDALSQALPWLVRHLGVAAAVEAVVGPVDGQAGVQGPGADQILPALRRIGFDARIAQRPLAELTAKDLPAVLLLRDGDACVLTRRHTDADGQALCTVVMPGPQVLELLATDDDIAAEYSGVALLVSRPPAPVRLAGRQPFGLVQRAEPSSLSALAAAIHSASQAMDLADRQPAAKPTGAGTDAVATAPTQAAAPTPALSPLPSDALPSASGPSTPDAALPVALADAASPSADDAVVLHLSFLQANSAASPWRRLVAAARARAVQALAGAAALSGRTRALPLAAAGRRVVAWFGHQTHRLGQALRPARAACAGALAAVATQSAQRGAALGTRLAALPGMAVQGRRQIPLARLAATPLWLGLCAVCLLVGTPLAWARMVSVSSLQAVATVLPGLLRQALAADQDRAVLALAAQRAALPAGLARAAGAPPPLALPATAAASATAGPSATGDTVRGQGVRSRSLPRRVMRMH